MYLNQRGGDGMGMDRRRAYLTGLLSRGSLGLGMDRPASLFDRHPER